MVISDTTDTLIRLRTVSGHVDGIARMVEEGADCFALVQQIRAVQASLRKVCVMLLDDYLHSSVLAAIWDKDPAQGERILMEVRQVIMASTGQGPLIWPRLDDIQISFP